MSYTEAEQQDFKTRLENHLLDGIDFFEYSDGWAWSYFDKWDGHRLKSENENPVVFKSYESCVKSVTYQMRNSTKNEYAKSMAHEGIKYMRTKLLVQQ